MGIDFIIEIWYTNAKNNRDTCNCPGTDRSIAKEKSVFENIVYLDNAAATRLDERVWRR